MGLGTSGHAPFAEQGRAVLPGREVIGGGQEEVMRVTFLLSQQPDGGARTPRVAVL